MPRTKNFDEQDALEKAMELFWKKGFHATSMQDLVDYLHINRASIYSTYGGKEALFIKAFRKYIKNNEERIQQFFDQQDTIKGGFRTMFLNAIDDSLQDPDRKGCFVVNVTTELVPDDGMFSGILKENLDSFHRFFTSLLEQAERKGEFESGKNLEGIAIMFHTFFSGIRVIAKLNPERAKLVQSVDNLMKVLD